MNKSQRCIASVICILNMVMHLCQKVWVLVCFCCQDVAAFCDCVYIVPFCLTCLGGPVVACVQLVVLWCCVLHQVFWWLADFLWFHDSPNGLLTAACVCSNTAVWPRVEFYLPFLSLCPWFVSTQRKPEEESPVQDTDAKQAKQETTVNGSSDSSANNGNGVQEGKSQQEASDWLLPFCTVALQDSAGMEKMVHAVVAVFIVSGVLA